MSKAPRYGLLPFVLLIICLFILGAGAGSVLATEDEAEAVEQSYTEAQKSAAIRAANEAILQIPQPRYIIHTRQLAVQRVYRARALVDESINVYGAVEADFPGLKQLVEAEEKVLMIAAIEEFHQAIDKLPPLDQITEADRAAVEEARRLADLALQYGATRFDLCWWYDALRDAEDKINNNDNDENDENDEEVDENDNDEDKIDKPEEPLRPMPPTGGVAGAIAAGLIFSGAGIYLIRKRKKLRQRI